MRQTAPAAATAQPMITLVAANLSIAQGSRLQRQSLWLGSARQGHRYCEASDQLTIRLPAIATLRTNAVVAHSRAVRLKSTPPHTGVLRTNARPSRIARLGTCRQPTRACGARSSRSSSAILDAQQLFLTCIKYCGDCLLIEVSSRPRSHTWQKERLGAPSSFHVQIPATEFKDCCRTSPSRVPMTYTQ
ncbi:hypothetical protein GGD63_005848 [Bradyrhizobium sp. cir1]|nr:hypothetical protein [Bradyrhizobium sp. cir1]